MMIDEAQFRAALVAAVKMTDEALLAEAGGTGARSYYVVHNDRTLPLKTVIRLAYLREGFDWDRPHSNVAARQLRTNFDIRHITKETEKRRLERQRESAERWARDPRFRVDVLDLYTSTCVVSGCTAPDALDAAHILGVGSAGEDRPQNGIVFRADLHRLFDAEPIQMAINPSAMTVHFAEECRQHFALYEGKVVTIPKGGPKPKAFAKHWKRFRKSQERGRG